MTAMRTTPVTSRYIASALTVDALEHVNVSSVVVVITGRARRCHDTPRDNGKRSGFKYANVPFSTEARKPKSMPGLMHVGRYKPLRTQIHPGRPGERKRVGARRFKRVERKQNPLTHKAPNALEARMRRINVASRFPSCSSSLLSGPGKPKMFRSMYGPSLDHMTTCTTTRPMHPKVNTCGTVASAAPCVNVLASSCREPSKGRVGPSHFT